MLLGLASKKIEMDTLSIMSPQHMAGSFIHLVSTQYVQDHWHTKGISLFKIIRNWYFLGYQIYFYIT